MDEGHLAFWKLAVFDVLSYHVAQDTAEILVARVGYETARVSEHAHEPAEKAEG